MSVSVNLAGIMDGAWMALLDIPVAVDQGIQE